jgi:arginase family enzyme
MIIKIPYTDGEHTGCSKGPDAILEELKHVWSNSSFRKFKVPEVKECTINSIEDGKVYLGGDHTITYYTVKHFVKSNPGCCFIVFDAHPDVYQQFDHPSHPDYLKFLVEEGILDPSNILVIGIRASHSSEIAYYKKKGIQYVLPYGKDLSAVCDGVMEFLRKFNSIYLSIDLDVIDPAFAPGVSYIEPGGLSSADMLYFARRLNKLSHLKCVDIVELNPDHDINSMTAKLAAKLVAEFL